MSPPKTAINEMGEQILAEISRGIIFESKKVYTILLVETPNNYENY